MQKKSSDFDFGYLLPELNGLYQPSNNEMGKSKKKRSGYDIKGKAILPYLYGCRLFAELSPKMLNVICEFGTIKVRQKGDYLYRSGDDNDKLFVLLKGKVKISKQYYGKEVFNSLVQSGMIFGESGLSKLQPRKSDCTVFAGHAIILEFGIDEIKLIMKRYCDLSLLIVKAITEKHIKLQNKMASMVLFDAKQRIIDFIYQDAQSYGIRVGSEILLDHGMTQQEIANITGTSRQTVVSVLKELKNAGVISLKRRGFLVKDLDRLVG